MAENNETTAEKVFSALGNDLAGTTDFKLAEHNVIPAYRFQLKVNGVFDIPLKSVRPINRKYEYENIQEGGLNDYVHIKRKPISQPYELIVERYMMTEIDDKLAVGSKMTLPLILYVGRANGRELSISQASRWYVFTGAQVLNVEFGGLDSERSGLLTETVTIGYNMMFAISSSSDSNADEQPFDIRSMGTVQETMGNTKWSFLTAANKDRVGKYATKKGIIEIGRKEMETAAKERLWQFDGDKENPATKAGKGKSSRQNGTYVVDKDGKPTSAVTGLTTPEASRGVLEGKRSLWQFALGADGKTAAVEGNEVRHVQNYRQTGKDTDGSAVYSGIGRASATKVEMEGAAATHLFQFGKDASEIAGNGVLSSQNYRETGKDDAGAPQYAGIGKAQKSKEDMAKGRKYWQFDGVAKAGKGDASRQNAKSALGLSEEQAAQSGIGKAESTRAEMETEANRHLFKFTESAKDFKGNGVVSARKDENSKMDKTKATLWEFAKEEITGPEPPPSMDGNGVRHVQNALKGKDDSGNDVITGMGHVELRKAEMLSAHRLWELTDQYTKDGNGVRSSQNGRDGEDGATGLVAVEASKSDLEEKRKLWKFSGTAKDGDGDRSRQNANKSDGDDSVSGLGTIELDRDKMEKGASLWNYSEGFNEQGTKANHPVNELRKDAMEGNADAPEYISAPSPSQPPARKWKFSGTDKTGGGTASHVSGETAEPSLEEMAGKAKQHIFVKRPEGGEKPQPRLWPDTKSAISGGNPNPQAEPIRKWPDTASAQKNPNTGSSPEARVWPASSSAVKGQQGQAAEKRQWPGTSSARHPNQGEPPEQRKWPDTASAQKNPNPGSAPSARLWPQVKSAQTIADFLMS
ncbi:MAG: hypothetical protein IJ058_04355 [Lachnospiraceae bacterium]|nr:hypothetical protein [Lachnospiraceae bacterium]